MSREILKKYMQDARAAKGNLGAMTDIVCDSVNEFIEHTGLHATHEFIESNEDLKHSSMFMAELVRKTAGLCGGYLGSGGTHEKCSKEFFLKMMHECEAIFMKGWGFSNKCRETIIETQANRIKEKLGDWGRLSSEEVEELIDELRKAYK